MAGLNIYKPGQGYWTRMMTAIGAGALVLVGVAWIMGVIKGAIRADYAVWVQAGVAVGVIVIVGGFLWWILNSARTVDFMIATEAEMRKVNWPTRRELILSTWIVICGSLLMAGALFGVDIVFGWLFREIGILQF